MDTLATLGTLWSPAPWNFPQLWGAVEAGLRSWISGSTTQLYIRSRSCNARPALLFSGFCLELSNPGKKLKVNQKAMIYFEQASDSILS
jgi:hypothetical protein